VLSSRGLSVVSVVCCQVEVCRVLSGIGVSVLCVVCCQVEICLLCVLCVVR
jgi:hypothetical protein